MSIRRTGGRRLTRTAIGVAALAAGTLTLADTGAAAPAPTPHTLTSSSASKLARTLTAGPENGTAGAYYDSTARKLVVNVLDDDAADRVRDAGAEPRHVEHSRAQLKNVQDSLGERAVPGTARGVNPKLNKVVVTADSTVRGAALNRLERDVAAQDGKAVLRRTAGTFRSLLSGGDAIYSSEGRCSLGFNVVKDGRPYFLTAGHCAALSGATWSETEGGPVVGEVDDYRFPGNDDALVEYTADVAHPSEVNLYDGSAQPISDAREAVVGERVRRSGSTTQVHDGTVQALDASISYPEGDVHGLIQTDVCAEPGDSGGSLFADNSALGLTSGGSGDCSVGGETFFAPVTDALDHYGAEIG
ncbi:trypsin-like serine protease [Streptomyces sp. p1417]|uniref:Trypsin-like serine protease n=1 Tax=Streptomyces typhae TaxID=2681492 RepID=A0A6L6WRZ0_9ACTN|nr:trypsin-like serine protease [Streptomyces typhae]